MSLKLWVFAQDVRKVEFILELRIVSSYSVALSASHIA